MANPGETVLLKCMFLADHFNLFDYPVLWRKTQLHDDVQVGQLVNRLLLLCCFVCSFIVHLADVRSSGIAGVSCPSICLSVCKVNVS